jgi:hypothetical protein
MDFDARTRLFTQLPVKVGVVADTYDNREGLRQLLDRFLVGGARWLFHCGGLGSANLVDLLKPWKARGRRRARSGGIEQCCEAHCRQRCRRR